MSMKEISENNLSYLLELIATHIKSEVSSIIVDVATNNSFGLVKPDNSTITINSGVISATATSPSIATTNSTGIVKPDDDTIGVQNDGTIYSKITYYTSSELDTMWANAYGGSSSGSGSSGSGSSGNESGSGSGSGSGESGSSSGSETTSILTVGSEYRLKSTGLTASVVKGKVLEIKDNYALMICKSAIFKSTPSNATSANMKSFFDGTGLMNISSAIYDIRLPNTSGSTISLYKGRMYNYIYGNYDGALTLLETAATNTGGYNVLVTYNYDSSSGNTYYRQLNSSGSFSTIDSSNEYAIVPSFIIDMNAIELVETDQIRLKSTS